MSDLPTLYVDPDAPERGAFTEQTCGDAPPTVVRYVPASVADALRAELARVRELGLDATDRAERLASALNDLRAENERLRATLEGATVLGAVSARHCGKPAPGELPCRRTPGHLDPCMGLFGEAVAADLADSRAEVEALRSDLVEARGAFSRAFDVVAPDCAMLRGFDGNIRTMEAKVAALTARAEKAEAEQKKWEELAIRACAAARDAEVRKRVEGLTSYMPEVTFGLHGVTMERDPDGNWLDRDDVLATIRAKGGK